MRYLRSLAFDGGLTLTLIGVLTALWLARELIAMTLKVSWLRFRKEGGAEVAQMNLSGFVLAALLALIGLIVLIVGVVRVRCGAI